MSVPKGHFLTVGIESAVVVRWRSSAGSRRRGSSGSSAWGYPAISYGPGTTIALAPRCNTSRSVIVGTPAGAGWDEADITDYTKAYFENFSSESQFPYLRIPGTFEYWTALDIHLSEAATDQITAQEAVEAIAADFEAITDRLGRDVQQEEYKASLGF